jgi:hypothetical protein
MKKLIAILLVLLVASVAFGAASDDDTLTLTTTVNAMPAQIKITNAALTTNGAFATATPYTAVISAIDPESTEAPTTGTLYANVRANSRVSFGVRVSAEDMKHNTPEIASSIGYSITDGTTTIDSAATHTEYANLTTSDELFDVDFTLATGMSVLNKSFSITLLGGEDDARSYRTAIAGAYTGTVKFYVTTD